MRLYCFPRSGNSREVKLALAEKGIAYESVNIHAETFDREDQEFRKASPKGRVPALIDQGHYLSEALDINVYLEDHYPEKALLPGDATRRTEILQWIREYDKRLTVKIGLYIVECLLKPQEKQNEQVKRTFKEQIVRGLGGLNEFHKGKDYLFGQYSLADIALTPHIAALGRVGIDISGYPHIAQWLERIKARPSFQASAG